jgi:hypothetical protein
MKMKRVLAFALAFALAGSLYAAEPPQDASTATTKTTKQRTAAKKSGPTVSSQLMELKQAMEAQQQQIQQLGQQVQSRDQHIQQLEQRLDQSQVAAAQAQAKADAAASQTAEQEQSVSTLKSDVTDLRGNAANVALSLQETQKSVRDQLESPAAIHFKGITITPGGFLAGESVWRNHALGAEATPFNSLNYPGSGQNRISEFFGSGRQSRISMLAEGKTSFAKLSGYYEADFLGVGITSNPNQTNSYALRQRQVWGQAAFNNGVTFTAGQMWTLATEIKKGVDNRTEAVPMTIDPNYTVGFSFARQWGVRVAKNFNNRFWLAASAENAQTIFAASGNASNFAFGGPGVGGGLYNSTANYSFNAMPDIIVKAVAEPGFGHYEVFGIFSRFRDRIYPCVEFQSNPGCGDSASALGAYNNNKNSGGLGANGRITIAKHTDFGLHFLYGNGVGRYSASGLPDATVRPNGMLAPLRSYQALSTLEFHFPKLDIYLNGGEDYVGRRYETDPVSLKVVGYGAPSFDDSKCYAETVPSAGTGFGFGSISCSGNTQRVIQGTIGFWIKPYVGPKGRIQFGPQYSYVTREAWTGTTATAPVTTFGAPHAVDNLFFTSFRYYLP